MDPVAAALVLVAAVLHVPWNVRLNGEGDRVAAMATSGLVSGMYGLGSRGALMTAICSPERAPRGETMSDQQVVEALRAVRLFQGFSDKDLAKLAGISKEVPHPAGKTVLEEDHSAIGFHLILSGEAEAIQGGTTVGTMHQGDYFGEMSLIDGKPRSASVVAKSDLVTLAIPAWNFERLLADHPEMMRALLVALSERIRHLRDRG